MTENLRATPQAPQANIDVDAGVRTVLAEVTTAATKVAEESESLRFAWQALCDRVADEAKQGRLLQFAGGERVVSLTVSEATELMGALDDLAAVLQRPSP